MAAGDCKAALHAEFPPELAEWLLDEMRDNRRPRGRAAPRRFWEGTDAEVRGARPRARGEWTVGGRGRVWVGGLEEWAVGSGWVAVSVRVAGAQLRNRCGH